MKTGDGFIRGDQKIIDRLVASYREEHKLLYPCALKANGDLVLWNQVGQGDYYCTEATCINENGERRRLQYIPTKDPTKRRSHFRHHNGQTGCTETVIHREAIKIIKSCREISTPPMDYNPNNDFHTASYFSNVICRQTDGNPQDVFIPDAVIIIDGYPVLVEITVTHNTDAEKIRTLARAGLPVLEIRLTVKTALDKYESKESGDFEHYVLHRARRRWLFHPDIDAEQEPDLANEDWAITFASQYKQRLSGQIRPIIHPIDPVLSIMQALPGIVPIADETIISGWFTTEPSIWQLEIIQHELLESVKAKEDDFHNVNPNGEGQYRSLDARAKDALSDEDRRITNR